MVFLYLWNLIQVLIQKASLINEKHVCKYKMAIDVIIKELEQFNDFQEFQFEMKEDLQEILTSFKTLMILELLRNQNNSDILEFFLKQENQKQLAQLGQNNINKIRNALINISQHTFNKKDYWLQTYQQIRQKLVTKIAKQEKIVYFFKFLVHLTAIEKNFIQRGSNSLNLLVKLKTDLSNQSWENIRIKDTSLIGGTFVRCNFNGSEFDNIDLRGILFWI
ncbi:unnamed protein product [Paramecium sonneborni]|uniref:Uncharacterized protein n=1 Tax=Paramecium sonneborni TaxID=65129 RepID=A0A8S1RIP3_9CILI|nr:unnamed protein product [Paramecium sonneborni]